MARISGIYIIQSISKPERVYVGSSVNIEHRWSDHIGRLRGNRHHSPQLQRHYNKYGLGDLVFEKIESGEYCDDFHLLAREQGWYYHFKYKDTSLPYFNVCEIAGNTMGQKPFLGRRHTEETKKKQSSAQMGHRVSDELIEKLRKANIGRKHSRESIEKRVALTRGKKRGPRPQWVKDKLSASMKGRKAWNKGIPHSEETKRKIGEKSRQLSPETRELIRIKLTGRKVPRDVVEKGKATKLKKKMENGN